MTKAMSLLRFMPRRAHLRFRNLFESLFGANQAVNFLRRVGTPVNLRPGLTKDWKVYVLADVPVGILYVDHFSKGIMKVSSSPHYEFARRIIQGKEAGGRYSQYLEEQYGMDEAESAVMERNFQNLVLEYISSQSNFVLETTIVDDDYLLVRDGFHRLATISAAESESFVKCKVFCKIIDGAFVESRRRERLNQSETTRSRNREIVLSKATGRQESL